MGEYTDPPLNTVLQCLMRSHIEALRVTCAENAMQMMLESDRIYNDLVTALEKPESWNQHFVLRQWVSIPLAFEIRGFVMNNRHKTFFWIKVIFCRLTALSQYYHYCFWQNLVDKKEQILHLILNFFELVKDKIPIHDKT